MSLEEVKPGGHSPITELVGLVEALTLLEGRIAVCVAACHEEGCGAMEVARILGVHRATVYRLSSWREGSERDFLRSTEGQSSRSIESEVKPAG
jgi:hypothetical protein